ncbi:MAG: Rieske (2Fe-2S) protein [Acidobacteria bacterium]|nr:Rieske (2Fe-2S) protein [Acidobacteriota bacterium]
MRARGRLGVLAWLSLLPLGGLWRSMVRAHGARPRTPRRHTVRGPLPEGLTVDGPVALWRDGDTVTAVSRRCPHLGCTVRPAADETLACPCHGSRFDPRGRLKRGPAGTDLAPLRVSRDSDGNGLVIDLPS